MYASLDEIGKAFYEATQAETDSLFRQGEVIYNAVQQGFKVDDVCDHCTSIIRRTKRTIYKRYAVYRTYPKPFPLPWEYHAIAADVVDYRCNDNDKIAEQQAKAREWLSKAIQEDWGTRQLKKAIGVTPNHDPNAYVYTVLASDVEARITHLTQVDNITELALEFDGIFEFPEDVTVLVTLVVKAPSVELEEIKHERD